LTKSVGLWQAPGPRTTYCLAVKSASGGDFRQALAQSLKTATLLASDQGNSLYVLDTRLISLGQRESDYLPNWAWPWSNDRQTINGAPSGRPVDAVYFHWGDPLVNNETSHAGWLLVLGNNGAQRAFCFYLVVPPCPPAACG